MTQRRWPQFMMTLETCSTWFPADWIHGFLVKQNDSQANEQLIDSPRLSEESPQKGLLLTKPIGTNLSETGIKIYSNFHTRKLICYDLIFEEKSRLKCRASLIIWPDFAVNKANLGDLIAATGLVILLKLDSNCRFFSRETPNLGKNWPWNLTDDLQKQ